MKTVGTLVILAGSLGTAQAQNWQLGARAGLAASGLAGQRPDYAPYKARLGGSVGVFARWQPGRHFSLKPELLYTLGGYRYESEYHHSGDLAYTTEDLHYLALPLLAAYHWHGAFLEVGPQVSWLLCAEQRTFYSGSNYHDNVDVTRRYPTFEAGAAAGAGWQRPQGLLLGLRYTRGLTALLPASFSDPARYSASLLVYAGYTFGRATAAGR